MHCVLCGWPFDEGESRRVRVTSELQHDIQAHWKPGPFITPIVMGLNECSCLTCLTCNSYLTRKTRPPAVMLPMDQYLLWLVRPNQEPDKRCSRRMREALNRENPYRFVIPGLVEQVREGANPVLEWHKRNLSTKYFTDINTAKLVRVAHRL
jgi:hypothetical protein